MVSLCTAASLSFPSAEDRPGSLEVAREETINELIFRADSIWATALGLAATAPITGVGSLTGVGLISVVTPTGLFTGELSSLCPRGVGKVSRGTPFFESFSHL